MNYANAGIPVIVKETAQDALDRGMAIIRKNYENSVKKGRFSQAVMDQRMALITPQLTYDGFEQADIIVEAVFEGMALKKQIFGELDKIAKPDCILASNTSTLDIDEIASATHAAADGDRPSFFQPRECDAAARNRARESHQQRSDRDLDGAGEEAEQGRRAGRKLPRLHRQSHDPLLRPRGAIPGGGRRAGRSRWISRIYDFGLAMGPLAMGDLAGLDVGWRIRKEFKHLEKPGVRIPHVADLLCEIGRYGQKTGKGWYKYDANRKPSPDPEVRGADREDRERMRASSGATITKEEIIERTIYALVNEGARILEEGIALRAVDIDIVYLNGYGFPAWRGGPMFYADTIGLKNVLAKIEEFEKRHGSDLWAPAPLLKNLAEADETFEAFDKEKESAAGSVESRTPS